MLTTEKGHQRTFKRSSLAQRWPLIPVATETIDGFAGLVTQIRDDNLWACSRLEQTWTILEVSISVYLKP